jgi:hypothetical protein
MKTGDLENTIELPTVVTIIQPALRRLYNMPGAGIDFKLLLLDLRDEIEGKVYQAFANVRSAQDKLNVASTEDEKVNAEKTLNQQYKLAEKTTITVASAKIPKSLIPDEKTVLSQRWNENTADGKQNLYGDYVTEVVNIYKYLIDTTK